MDVNTMTMSPVTKTCDDGKNAYTGMGQFPNLGQGTVVPLGTTTAGAMQEAVNTPTQSQGGNGYVADGQLGGAAGRR